MKAKFKYIRAELDAGRLCPGLINVRAHQHRTFGWVGSRCAACRGHSWPAVKPAASMRLLTMGEAAWAVYRVKGDRRFWTEFAYCEDCARSMGTF